MAEVSAHHQIHDAPHSGHRMTTRSSDGTLSRHIDDHHQQQHQQHQSHPVASPPRPNRKRAASINVQEANRSRIENLSLHTPLETEPGSSSIPHDVCICPPSPKVPRPRNAFILYRQHQQARVVQQNPGLPNPEISKILGEQWKSEPAEVQAKWRDLAEEEKQRHQEQHPGYKYKPKRGGKGLGTKASHEEEGSHCPKCQRQRRVIAVPRTPATPLATPTTSRSAMPTHHNSMHRLNDSGHHRHQWSPGGAFPHDRRRSYIYQDAEDDYAVSPSADYKRRRFDSRGSFQSMPSPYMHQQSPGWPGHRQGYTASTPYTSSAAFSPLPAPSSLAHQNAPMPPPSRPAMSDSRDARRFDHPIRLPPLQTQVAQPSGHVGRHEEPVSTTKASGLGIVKSSDSHSQSIAAMVMSIPYTNKLEMLNRISPALAPGGQDSPGMETRGPLIAIEGTDSALMKEVGLIVQEGLAKSGECAVRTWSGGPTTQFSDEALEIDDDAQMRDGLDSGKERPGHVDSPASPNSFLAYLGIIKDWHPKSDDIIKHITTVPGAKPIGDTGGSESGSSAAEPEEQRTVPVALITDGFRLSTSDRFASSIPISDSYAPVDHWQWMATLWRSIIGPDLVIFADRVTEDGPDQLRDAEFREEPKPRVPKLMTVRVPRDKELDEKTKRRLTFEIMEWVRAGTFRMDVEARV